MTEHRRYPFLPASKLGWTPYAWLVYLVFFLAEPLFFEVPPWEIAATAAVVAVFLPLYFWGYWQSGWRALLPVTAIALLGTLAAPWNHGAAVFFIYASGYLGSVGPPRRAVPLLAALLAWIGAVAWIFGLGPYFWAIGLVFSLLVAGINIHFAAVSRRDAALRRSQDEVERLAQVAERERIARDLHDLLGHTLSLITLKAELAGKLLGRGKTGGHGGEDGAVAREVADIERISRRALDEVREAVLGYRSAGLAAEMERAERALESAGVECSRTASPRALGRAAAVPERERALSFVLREAVTNVLRHAGAGHCEIHLEIEDGDGDGRGEASGGDELRLVVADDGRGGGDDEGAGLTGMRERLADLGGRLHRDGDGGTRLLAVVPAPHRAGGPGARGDDGPTAAPAEAAVDDPGEVPSQRVAP